jgi:hypothetical protein
VDPGESLTWHRNFPDGLIAGGVFLGLGCGTLLTVPMGLFFSLEWWWPSVVMPALVAFGVGAGVLERRLAVSYFEFSGDGVGLVSDRRERFVAATDLTRVIVEHSDDFAWTTVRLEIEGQPQVWVPGPFDPEVAAVLTRLLGPTVEVSEPRKVLPPGDSALS